MRVTLRRLLTRLRDQTRSVTLAILLLATGMALLLIELARSDLWFAAAGTIPLTVVAGFVIHKLGRTSALTSRVMKSLRRTDGYPSAPALGAAIPTHTGEELRIIGAYTPKAHLTSRLAGRQAAAVERDPQASARLFAATHGMGAALAPPHRGRVIALIGPKSTADRLSEHCHVVMLHPSLSQAELSYHLPSAVVIDETANSEGPWATALEPVGAVLFEEIAEVVEWAAKRSMTVHVVPGGGTSPLGSTVLRSLRTHIVALPEDSKEGGASGVMQALTTLVGERREGVHT